MLVCGAMTLQAQETEPRYEREGDLIKATFYHDNGIVAQKGYFLGDQLHGEWVMYNTQGEKIALGQYTNGLRTGKWFFWEGDNLKEVDFTDNRIVSVVNWDNGTKVVVNK